MDGVRQGVFNLTYVYLHISQAIRRKAATVIVVMLALGSAHSITEETATHGSVISLFLMPCKVSRGYQQCIMHSSLNGLWRSSAPTFSKARSGAAPADTPAGSLHTPTIRLHE